MKIASTNQTLILAGERTPTRRRADSRLTTVKPATRGDGLPSTLVSSGDSTAVSTDVEPVSTLTYTGRYASFRSSSLNPAERYAQVQQMAETDHDYGRIDVYA